MRQNISISFSGDSKDNKGCCFEGCLRRGEIGFPLRKKLDYKLKLVIGKDKDQIKFENQFDLQTKIVQHFRDENTLMQRDKREKQKRVKRMNQKLSPSPQPIKSHSRETSKLRNYNITSTSQSKTSRDQSLEAKKKPRLFCKQPYSLQTRSTNYSKEITVKLSQTLDKQDKQNQEPKPLLIPSIKDSQQSIIYRNIGSSLYLSQQLIMPSQQQVSLKLIKNLPSSQLPNEYAVSREVLVPTQQKLFKN